MQDPDSCTKQIGNYRELSQIIDGMWKKLFSTAEILVKL